MLLSIRAKLFLTVLAVVVLAVIAVQAFGYWSFLRNLQQLAEARHQERIEQIAERLAAHYARGQSWLPLKQDKRLWLQAGFGAREWQHHPRAEHRQLHGLPPWLRRALLQQDQCPPPEAGLSDPPGGKPRSGRAEGRRGHSRARGTGPSPLPFRLMLLDADDTMIYRRRDLLAEARRYPLELDGRHIGTLAYQRRPTDIAELVADRVSDASESFTEQGLELGMDRVGSGHWLVDSDPDRLTQLMQNLLENSRVHRSRTAGASPVGAPRGTTADHERIGNPTHPERPG